MAMVTITTGERDTVQVYFAASAPSIVITSTTYR